MSRRFAWLILLLSLLAFASGCGGPLPFLSGGALSGEIVEPPSKWSEWTKQASVIQLETNPTNPYSVNIAYTVVDGNLYVYAGDTRTQWVEHMDSDPNVRFRRGGLVYELRAERVTDEIVRGRFAEAWAARGLFSRDPQTLGEVWLYRLHSRR